MIYDEYKKVFEEDLWGDDEDDIREEAIVNSTLAMAPQGSFDH